MSDKKKSIRDLKEELYDAESEYHAAYQVVEGMSTDEEGYREAHCRFVRARFACDKAEEAVFNAKETE